MDRSHLSSHAGYWQDTQKRAFEVAPRPARTYSLLSAASVLTLRRSVTNGRARPLIMPATAGARNHPSPAE